MRLRVESDGGSRGNPGLAGAGSSVVDPASVIAGDPKELACQWEYIEQATNNVAEYHGLINALQLAAEVAQKSGEATSDVDVDVFMDSKLIVEQMSGRWKIKHPDMKPLAQRVKELEKSFAGVSYTWVPRAQNKRADELANRAMDDKDSGVTFSMADAKVAEAKDSGTPVEGGGVGVEKEVRQEKTTLDAPAAPDWHTSSGRPTRFLLLRHGQTDMSVAKQYSGLSDPELNQTGRYQAQRAAEYIGARGGVHAVLSSPLARARETADAVAEALGVDAQVDDGLIEMDFGEWEGKTFAEVRSSDPQAHQAFFNDAHSCPPQGECHEAIYERMTGVIDSLVEQYPGQNVVLVSHVTPIKAILRYALKVDATIFRTLHLGLAGLSIVEFFPDGASMVRRVNDAHYLE